MVPGRPAGRDNPQIPLCYTATVTRWQSGFHGANTMHSPAAKQESFIVRIWQDQRQAGWRGWVQHTRTGESKVVGTVQELLAFIEQRTGKLDDTPHQGLK